MPQLQKDRAHRGHNCRNDHEHRSVENTSEMKHFSSRLHHAPPPCGTTCAHGLCRINFLCSATILRRQILCHRVSGPAVTSRTMASRWLTSAISEVSGLWEVRE